MEMRISSASAYLRPFPIALSARPTHPPLYSMTFSGRGIFLNGMISLIRLRFGAGIDISAKSG
jgi:hypothetical protein